MRELSRRERRKFKFAPCCDTLERCRIRVRIMKRWLLFLLCCPLGALCFYVPVARQIDINRRAPAPIAAAIGSSIR
mgnify:CR=1 FL=1